MTLEDFYRLLQVYSSGVVLILLFMPWIAWGICRFMPGRREESIILNSNLFMAIASLFLAIGYLWHATHSQAFNQVLVSTDILLLTAPFYYFFISLWLTKQRIALSQLQSYRAVQGLALIGAGYLGISYLMSKFRLIVFSYMPFKYLVILILGLLGIAYLGYLKIMGKDGSSPSANSPRPRRPNSPRNQGPSNFAMSIEEELDDLRRKL